MFASVEDLARSVGVPWNKVGGISLSEMVQNLRAIGASVGALKTVTKMSDVVAMMKRDGSVVLVSFRCMRAGKEVSGHAMYVFYDYLGRFRIMDRTGVYDDLRAIAKQYDRIDEFIPRAAAEVSGVYAKVVDGITVLAMEIRGVVATQK